MRSTRRSRHAVALLAALCAVAALPSAAAGAPRAHEAVFAGTPAAAGSAPWMVGISVGCGGSLVAPDRVLTAAHCLQDLAWADLRVRVGAEHARGRLYDGEAVGIRDIAVHPLYDGARSSGHDVALIRLSRPLTGRPLLALEGDPSTPAGAPATVIGFGASRTARQGVSFPVALRQGALRVLSDRSCLREYRGAYERPTMICARDRDGVRPTTSPCIGDSGGPLVVNDAAGVPRQAGVVSFGRVCGLNGEPSVYARVAGLRDFIDDASPTWAPAPVGRPAVTGNLRPGGTIRCTGVTWRNAPDALQYRWRVGGTILDPTRRSRRTLPRFAAGRDVACRIAATNAGGTVRSAVAPPRRVANR